MYTSLDHMCVSTESDFGNCYDLFGEQPDISTCAVCECEKSMSLRFLSSPELMSNSEIDVETWKSVCRRVFGLQIPISALSLHYALSHMVTCEVWELSSP